MSNKLDRKRKTKDPCPRCALHKDLCICAVIPSLNLKTKVTLVIHAKELKRTTNTGRLAMDALVNSQMCVRGLKDEPLSLENILTDQYESVLFYPSDDAIELEEFVRARNSRAGKLPIQLIVPDGNWRQASKVSTRQSELAALPRVKITQANLGASHLRKEHFSEGMSTLEAIASALRIIEGDVVGATLLALYQAKLQATLRGRGQSELA
ncbi:MAG: tRNA-uridine aminocarboxypropyltransferase [Bdellovibrionota bacterium]